jgi:mono/diheme cytochrome c family protein
MKRSIVLLALFSLSPASQAAPSRLSYTETQAAQGAAIYRSECALCHGAALLGGWETPPLTGRFVANWAGAPLSSLSGYIRRAMPQMAPGTLSAADTAAVVAFLLQRNGVKPGASPLPDAPGKLERLVFPKEAGR